MAQQLLKNPLPPPSKLGNWPNAPAKKGIFYQVNDPIFQKDQLVVMLLATWTEVGTVLESNKRVMAAQDQKVKELNAANHALAAQLNDMQERMENLRAAYREAKRAQLTTENPELATADAARQTGPKTKYF